MMINIKKRSLLNQKTKFESESGVAIAVKLTIFMILYIAIIVSTVYHFTHRSNGRDLFIAAILAIIGIVVSTVSLRK